MKGQGLGGVRDETGDVPGGKSCRHLAVTGIYHILLFR